MTRNELGTMPLLAPECTASVKTSTRSVPIIRPRRLVVLHICCAREQEQRQEKRE